MLPSSLLKLPNIVCKEVEIIKLSLNIVWGERAICNKSDLLHVEIICSYKGSKTRLLTILSRIVD